MRTQRLLLYSCWFALACVQELAVGQSSAAVDTEAGSSTEPDGNTEAGSSTEPDGNTEECVPVRCRGAFRACGDCLDNDGDGLVDAEDPDCWGDCDADESVFGAGATTGACVETDCWFDPDCGSGNDARCVSLTPNGCDCRGCCVFDSTRPDIGVRIGSTDTSGVFTCNHQSVSDPSRCQTCAVDLDCFNPCDPCDRCIDRREPALSCE